jgi:hypothetical protein
MTLIQPSLAQKRYPIRYWIFVAYAVGVPNFVKFDGSGRTHEFGLFNPTSISTIILTLSCAFLLHQLQFWDVVAYYCAGWILVRGCGLRCLLI